MSIKITYPREWYDHQPRYCSACSKPAKLKIEVRPDPLTPESKEYGPAQTLRLCPDHLVGLGDVLYEDTEAVRSRQRKGRVRQLLGLRKDER